MSKISSNGVSGSIIIYERRRKMSQKALAEILGISEKSLRKIERGQAIPDEATKAKLREKFGAERFAGCWEGA
ncbi:MAG: helix-turn-helix transcriptional regulator [Lachnospiraceae bacterium]|nr:helix-turn-helix transcriptional regulator [Lachnospiraceae bacterium]